MIIVYTNILYYISILVYITLVYDNSILQCIIILKIV